MRVKLGNFLKQNKYHSEVTNFNNSKSSSYKVDFG